MVTRTTSPLYEKQTKTAITKLIMTVELVENNSIYRTSKV